MLTGQAAGLASPAEAGECGTRHLDVDKALADFHKINFTKAAELVKDQQGRDCVRTSPTDDTVRLFFWKSVVPCQD